MKRGLASPWSTPPCRPRGAGATSCRASPAEVLEAAGRPAAANGFQRRPQEFDGDLPDEPRVARQAEHEVDPVLFAPGHQHLAGEAGIAAQQNARPRPAAPDLGDDARDLLDRAGDAVDVRPPELGRQEMPAAEYVERHVAVAIVVAVEEPALLMAVSGSSVASRSRMISFGGRPCALEEEIDEQGLDRRGLVAILRYRWAHPATARAGSRRFARNRRAVVPPASSLPASTAITGS